MNIDIVKQKSVLTAIACSVFVRYIDIMQQTNTSEAIEVLASFKKNGLTPLLFKRDSRIFKINSIDLKYSFKKGLVEFFVFCVSSERTSYKIIYDSHSLSWKLEEIFTQ